MWLNWLSPTFVPYNFVSYWRDLIRDQEVLIFVVVSVASGGKLGSSPPENINKLNKSLKQGMMATSISSEALWYYKKRNVKKTESWGKKEQQENINQEWK